MFSEIKGSCEVKCLRAVDTAEPSKLGASLSLEMEESIFHTGGRPMEQGRPLFLRYGHPTPITSPLCPGSGSLSRPEGGISCHHKDARKAEIKIIPSSSAPLQNLFFFWGGERVAVRITALYFLDRFYLPSTQDISLLNSPPHLDFGAK